MHRHLGNVHRKVAVTLLGPVSRVSAEVIKIGKLYNQNSLQEKIKGWS